MMVHIRVVQHDLAPAAQLGAMIGLAFDEAVDQPAAEIGGARSPRQLEPGIAIAL